LLTAPCLQRVYAFTVNRRICAKTDDFPIDLCNVGCIVALGRLDLRSALDLELADPLLGSC
jgi:hypothetical protein